MVNAWSLLYDEIYGIDKMTDDKNRITPQESDEYDPPEEKQPKTYDEMIAAGYEMTGDGFGLDQIILTPNQSILHIITTILVMILMQKIHSQMLLIMQWIKQ